jgi:hypothetical protein
MKIDTEKLSNQELAKLFRLTDKNLSEDEFVKEWKKFQNEINPNTDENTDENTNENKDEDKRIKKNYSINNAEIELKNEKARLRKIGLENNQKKTEFLKTKNIKFRGKRIELTRTLKKELKNKAVEHMLYSNILVDYAKEQKFSIAFVTITINTELQKFRHKRKGDMIQKEMEYNPNFNKEFKDDYIKRGKEILQKAHRRIYNKANYKSNENVKILYSKSIEMSKNLSPHLHALYMFPREYEEFFKKHVQNIKKDLNLGRIDNKIIYSHNKNNNTKTNNEDMEGEDKNVENVIGYVMKYSMKDLSFLSDKDLQEIKDNQENENQKHKDKKSSKREKHLEKQYNNNEFSNKNELLYLINGWRYENKIQLYRTSNVKELPRYVFRRMSFLSKKLLKNHEKGETLLTKLIETTKVERKLKYEYEQNKILEIKNIPENHIYTSLFEFEKKIKYKLKKATENKVKKTYKAKLKKEKIDKLNNQKYELIEKWKNGHISTEELKREEKLIADEYNINYTEYNKNQEKIYIENFIEEAIKNNLWTHIEIVNTYKLTNFEIKENSQILLQKSDIVLINESKPISNMNESKPISNMNESKPISNMKNMETGGIKSPRWHGSEPESTWRMSDAETIKSILVNSIIEEQGEESNEDSEGLEELGKELFGNNFQQKKITKEKKETKDYIQYQILEFEEFDINNFNKIVEEYEEFELMKSIQEEEEGQKIKIEKFKEYRWNRKFYRSELWNEGMEYEDEVFTLFQSLTSLGTDEFNSLMKFNTLDEIADQLLEDTL